MTDGYQYQTVISGGHPALEGHFPGNPVVPGVVILESVAQALSSWRSGTNIVEFPSVKFHHVLKPNLEFEIRLRQVDSCKYRFDCDCDGQIISSGTFISQTDHEW